MNLNTIVQEIQQYNLVLSGKEQRSKLGEYQNTRDENIREQLILSNIGLVLNVIKKYPVDNQYDREVLFQEGLIGLMKAIDTFDAYKGATLGTYATLLIKQNIGRYMYDQSTTVRISTNMRQKIFKMATYQERYFVKFGKKPSVEEIAFYLKISPDKVEKIKRYSNMTDILSLNKTYIEDEESELMETIIDESVCVEDFCIQSDIGELLRELMDKHLTEREKQILKMRFGMDEYHIMTLDEAGRVLGITRERVRQIQNDALKKLRKCGKLEELLV